MIFGSNVHVAWEEQKDPAVRAEIRAQLKAMGVKAVRVDFAWDGIEPNKDQWYWDKLDTRINEFAEDGMKVLLMLYWPPTWASLAPHGKPGVPRDPEEFGNACGKAAQRYGDKLAGVEMWNEPDLDPFWAGSAEDFSDLLAGAYPVAKAMAPNTTFVAAAPTYLGLAEGWFENMYSADTYRPGVSYDAQAIHPYMSPSDLPPNAPSSEWSILGIEELLKPFRASYNDDSPLWVTEFGWSNHENEAGAPPWKLGVTEQEQAAFTLGALMMFEAMGIEQAYVYVERDMAQTAEPHERNFGMLTTDNQPKPVADLLTAVYNWTPTPPPDSDIEERLSAVEGKLQRLSDNLRQSADDLL